jgi:predicted deacylase
MIKPKEYFGLKPTLKYKDFGNYGCGSYKVAIIGGTHGNEPAGTAALEMLVGSGYFDEFTRQHPKISVRVIPRVNEWGLKLGVRHQPHLFHPDINRNYVLSSGKEDGLESTSKQVVELTKNFNLIIDLHEGWGYHQLTPESIGSTLSYTGQFAGILAHKAADSINNTLHSIYKFVVLDPNKHPSCDISTTLRCIRDQTKKDYILIETTGQNDIQPLMVRVNQHQHIIQKILSSIAKL